MKEEKGTEQISSGTITKSSVNDSPVGLWGDISGSLVNYIDESTGNIVSGVSKGFGLNLNADGTFIQTTVIISGRPDYKIFVSTTGKWDIQGNQLTFHPEDRHYRKWENQLLTTDEHSNPEKYKATWSKRFNQNTGKECLYIRYEFDTEDRELCKE